MSKNMRKRIVLVRTGWLNKERFVQLVSANGEVWWIDPQREVSEAIGLEQNRHSCIVSFADGLVAAGKDVIISEHFRGQEKRHAPHVNRLRHEESQAQVQPIYFYLGITWGANLWLPLKLALQCIKSPQRRQEIFWTTAKRLVEDHLEQQRRSGKTGKLQWELTADEQALVWSLKPALASTLVAVAGGGQS